MLVWLASYPRSGNTLLRQVLKTCFGLNSCQGLEQFPPESRGPNPVGEEFYGLYFADNPEEFYQRARRSPGPVLVKTHRLPCDDSKAIYVVRDGRLALKSFLKYQDTYHPGASSFESLLVGDHPYGEWSAHFRAWCDAGRGETMMLRFEDLVNAEPDLLARLSEFLGLPGPLRPWANRLARLRELEPANFGNGERVWAPDPFWTEPRLRQFFTLHGPLLARLGYATPAEVEATAYPADSAEERLLRLAHDLAQRRNGLQLVCDERRVEIDRLASACGERLAEIDHLASVCAERLSLIDRLSDECAALAQTVADLDGRLAEADAELRRRRQPPPLDILSRFRDRFLAR